MRIIRYTFISLLLLIFNFSSQSLFAQARAYFNQYLLNNYMINPAVSGIENYTDLRASFKKQWVGILGAPVTQTFTVHTAIGKKDTRITPNSFYVKGENPYELKLFEENNPGFAHHGVGLMFMNDKAGYISRMNLSGSYAYHTPIGLYSMLSGGISIGFSSFSADRTKVDFASTGQDSQDPALGNFYDDLNKKKLELGAGLWFYSPYFYAGLSGLNLIPGKSNSFGSDAGSSFTPNYIATAGYKFFISDQVSLMPSAMVQYWKPSLKCMNFSAKVQYSDLIWLAANYRASDLVGGYAAMAGFNLGNALNFSYCYEASPTSELQQFTKATHEVMIGIIFGNNYSNIFKRNYQ